MGDKGKKINYALDPYFDKKRAMIYIEHSELCAIFKDKALEFHDFLIKNFEDWSFMLIRNATKPREGAFEIKFAQNARMEPQLLWSGIDKGPPRREKFPPTMEQFLPEVTSILKKVYIDVKDLEAAKNMGNEET